MWPEPSLEGAGERPIIVSDAAGHVPVIDIQAAAEDVEQRGLAAATGAHERQHLARRHRRRDALEDAFLLALAAVADSSELQVCPP